MSYTLGKTYKTHKGEARLVGVDGEWLLWERKGQEDTHGRGRFRTGRYGKEVRAPRQGAVEVRT